MNKHELKQCREIVVALLKAMEASYEGKLSQSHTETLREVLLLFGSHSEDNLAAVSHLEYALSEETVQSDKDFTDYGKIIRKYKMLLKGSRIPLTDVLYELENMELPDAIKSCCPGLTQQEWEAAMRVSMFLVGMYATVVHLIPE